MSLFVFHKGSEFFCFFDILFCDNDNIRHSTSHSLWKTVQILSVFWYSTPKFTVSISFSSWILTLFVFFFEIECIWMSFFSHIPNLLKLPTCWKSLLNSILSEKQNFKFFSKHWQFKTDLINIFSSSQFSGTNHHTQVLQLKWLQNGSLYDDRGIHTKM